MNGKWLVKAIVLVFVSNFTAHAASQVELISKYSGPQQISSTASGESLDSQYSPDGSLIFFTSNAPDLIDGGSDVSQLYVRGRAAGTLRVVSVNQNGAPGNAISIIGGVSADNRYVAFQSAANNLVPNDGNASSDIFLRDLVDGTTTLVSHLPALAGNTITPNGVSEYPQISRDGKWVVFESLASNLVPGDTNHMRDIFAWNRLDGSVHCVSYGPQNVTLATDSANFLITADSHYVLFEGNGQILTSPNKTGAHVYLRDLEAETTRWISWPATNLPNMAAATFSSAGISEDGRFVFLAGVPTGSTTAKPALVRVDLNDNSALFVTNLFFAGVPSVTAGPSISNDGQFAAWANGTNIFRWSADSGQIERVDTGAASDSTVHSDSPQLSPDGRCVIFNSDSTNLVAGADNGTQQIFMRDMQAGVTRLISSGSSGGPIDDLGLSYAEFSPDGAKILMETDSSELVSQDSNGSFDVFEWDMATSSLSLLSTKNINTTAVTGPGRTVFGFQGISSNANYIAFWSTVPFSDKDTNGMQDVYLADRLKGAVTLVSATPDGYSPGVPSGKAWITSDGKWVAFETTAKGLAGPADTRTASNVYARNTETGEMLNISGPQANPATFRGFSANGQFAFIANGNLFDRFDFVNRTNLVISTINFFYGSSADGNRILSNYQILDLANGTQISLAPSGSYIGVISPDGATVYYRNATGITATNVITKASRTVSVPVSGRLAIDSSGQIATYALPSGASQPGAVYYVDFRSGENVLVSRSFGTSNFANDASGAPVVSPDGRFIAYESFASDIVPGDGNGTKDVFLYDRYTDQTTLLSHKPNSNAPGNSLSANPYFSPDGSMVGFISVASDLVTGDLNEQFDVFITSVGGSTITDEDADNDGLPDWWERANFSTLKYSGDDDFDGDGFSNRAELHAGTNPTDAASALKILTIGLEPNGARSLVWSSVAGKSYRVQFTSGIETPAWTTVLDNIPATTDTVKAIDATTSVSGFYRIVIAR